MSPRHRGETPQPPNSTGGNRGNRESIPSPFPPLPPVQNARAAQSGRTVILGQSRRAMTKSKNKAPAHEFIVAFFGCKSISNRDIYTIRQRRPSNTQLSCVASHERTPSGSPTPFKCQARRDFLPRLSESRRDSPTNRNIVLAHLVTYMHRQS